MLLEGELSNDGSVLRLEELKKRISVKDDLKVDYALSMSGMISIYRGYCTKKKLTKKISSLIDLILIMRGLHAPKSACFFSEICTKLASFILLRTLRPPETSVASLSRIQTSL